jgi:RNA polymerase sigma-70 factor, ECF subfamily
VASDGSRRVGQRAHTEPVTAHLVPCGAETPARHASCVSHPCGGAAQVEAVDELTRLLLDAADGDRLALSSFVRQTQPDVWRFCAHLVDPGAADDLTQEVYLRAMRSVGRFRGDASARTWLFSVARNTAADEIRRRRRRRRLPDPAPESVSDDTEVVALRDLVDQLDPDRREAFVLTRVNGLSYAEAAAVCRVPIGTIRSRVARARADLVHRLADAEVAGAGAGDDHADEALADEVTG